MMQPREHIFSRLFEILLIRDTILGNLKNPCSLEEVQAIVSLQAIGALRKEDLTDHFQKGAAKIRNDPLKDYDRKRDDVDKDDLGVGDPRPEYIPEIVYRFAKKGLAARKVLRSCGDAYAVTRKCDIVNENMHKYLIYACSAGLTVDEVEKLCTLSEWNKKDGECRRPLVMAASYGHLEIVELFFLTKRVYDLGCEALFPSVANGQVDVVRYLIDTRMYNLNAMNFDEKTPLMDAAEGGHTEIVQMLLDNEEVGADFQGYRCEEYDPGDLMTPLMYASLHGHGEVVRVLLESGKVQVALTDRFSRTALIYAAIGGSARIVDVLLGLDNVDVNSKDLLGNTALIYACADGYTEVVRLLLESGKVDVNIPKEAYTSPAEIYHNFFYEDEFYRYDLYGNAEEEYRLGQTPIMFAATNGYLDIVKLLFEVDDIDLNRKDRHGMSLLAHAMTSPHAHVAEFLIKSDEFDLNAMDVTGNTPLMHASQWGLEQVVKALLETGKVDVNLKAPCGRTALDFALEYENVQAIKALLESENVDVNSTDSEGKTILIRASIMGNIDMVRLLLESRRTSIHAEDYTQRNALMYATENDYPDIVSLLEHQMSLV